MLDYSSYVLSSRAVVTRGNALSDSGKQGNGRRPIYTLRCVLFPIVLVRVLMGLGRMISAPLV